jgi:hypothetical protein
MTQVRSVHFGSSQLHQSGGPLSMAHPRIPPIFRTFEYLPRFSAPKSQRLVMVMRNTCLIQGQNQSTRQRLVAMHALLIPQRVLESSQTQPIEL